LIQVNQLIEEGKVKEAFQVILELEQTDVLSFKEKISCKLIKANLFRVLGNYSDSIECAETVFQESQKLGDKLSSFDALAFQAHSYLFMVDIKKSEALVKQAQDLFRIIKGTLSIDLRERESFLARIEAGINFFKGEIQTALELNKKAYDLAKDTENETMISACLNNNALFYFHLEEYDKAIMYAKDAVRMNNRFILANALGTLIEIYVGTGNIKEAKANLEILRDHVKEFDIEQNKTIYIFMKALLLKSSLRARDRIKSEDLFKGIALDDAIFSENRIDAIIHLCDLYLIELRITNDPEIINEIQLYIRKLLDIANNQHMYLVLAETCLLQAKLSLLTSEIKKAKKFLIQAQNIAETYGLKRFAINISNEHDKLLNQVSIWENFKQSEVPLSKRLKLAGLNEQMDYMMKKRIIEAPKLSDEEPVLLLILSEGGIPFLSQSFIEDKSFASHLFGGFLTTINSFIREMFSEGLDRAVFGDYTLLMKSIPPFFISYIFKGNSYIALQKLDYFNDHIQKEDYIWKKLLKYFQANQSIQLKDVPLLESLITEIFIAKTIISSEL